MTSITIVSYDPSGFHVVLIILVSKLQASSKRIRTASQFISNVAEELAADDQTIYRLIHQISQETGSAQGGYSVCEQSSPELDEGIMSGREFLRYEWR